MYLESTHSITQYCKLINWFGCWGIRKARAKLILRHLILGFHFYKRLSDPLWFWGLCSGIASGGRLNTRRLCQAQFGSVIVKCHPVQGHFSHTHANWFLIKTQGGHFSCLFIWPLFRYLFPGNGFRQPQMIWGLHLVGIGRIGRVTQWCFSHCINEKMRIYRD